MKKSTLLIAIFALSVVALAFFNPMDETKIGHIDSDYIFKKIPAYQDAQKEIDNLAAQYKTEVEAKYAQVDSLYKVYQKEEVLLPQDMKVKKQNEIIQKENDAKDLQKKYFGDGGALDQKRQELLKPIQDNVYNTLKKMADAGNYDYIFDKNTGEILYARTTRDMSDNLLKQLGY